jgi:AcrR family transcriptional regulator
MPKVTRSDAQVNAVREKILDCAFDILAKNGYESLSMAGVGNKMKMTAANLYNYFTNKDELLIGIHKRAYAMLFDDMTRAVAAEIIPMARYEKMTHAFVAFATNNIHIYDIMFNRPVKQYSDYIGTPQEKLSYDEYHSSLKVKHLIVDVIDDYRKTLKNAESAGDKYLPLQWMSLLHGLISLKNSGVLKQIHKDPQAAMQSVIDNTLRMILE